MIKHNQNKGITLIALVVTIIVLLILAGISINMLTGQNGILNRAGEAKEKTETANKDEQRKLAQAEALMNTEKTTYKGLTLPEGFAPTKIEGEDSVDDGLVITDGYGNEYVWVEVPRTVAVYPTAGINITEFTEKEYEDIEADLHSYTADYRKGTSYNDVYYADDSEGWFTETGDASYDTAKKKMLKSVYQNEGFWVGRYEAGIENEENIRNTKTDTVTLIPVTKQNMYPYTHVTRTQAKVLAEKVESGSYTSSLMFGVQWDLILKYIENKFMEKNTNSDIKTKLTSDSTTIGNYNNNLYNVKNANAKYSTNYGSSFEVCPYPKKTNENVLLTTGADESFSLMNIYDIAGNLREWTLEKTSNEERPCTYRGCDFTNDGSTYQVSYRDGNFTSFCNICIGFRVVLY